MVVAPCASTTEVTDRTSTIHGVDDARRRDGELAVAVGHEGRVLEDGLLAAAARALEEDLRVRVVRQVPGGLFSNVHRALYRGYATHTL